MKLIAIAISILLNGYAPSEEAAYQRGLDDMDRVTQHRWIEPDRWGTRYRSVVSTSTPSRYEFKVYSTSCGVVDYAAQDLSGYLQKQMDEELEKAWKRARAQIKRPIVIILNADCTGQLVVRRRR